MYDFIPIRTHPHKHKYFFFPFPDFICEGQKKAATHRFITSAHLYNLPLHIQPHFLYFSREPPAEPSCMTKQQRKHINKALFISWMRHINPLFAASRQKRLISSQRAEPPTGGVCPWGWGWGCAVATDLIVASSVPSVTSRPDWRSWQTERRANFSHIWRFGGCQTLICYVNEKSNHHRSSRWDVRSFLLSLCVCACVCVPGVNRKMWGANTASRLNPPVSSLRR